MSIRFSLLQWTLPFTLAFATAVPAANVAQTAPTPHVHLAQSASSTPKDGKWWLQKSPPFQEGYVLGYHAGMVKALEGHPTPLKGIQSQQLVDGLNAFYDDFRNRKILVDDALPYVVLEISGAPDDQLKSQLLKLRQAAAGRSQ